MTLFAKQKSFKKKIFFEPAFVFTRIKKRSVRPSFPPAYLISRREGGTGLVRGVEEPTLGNAIPTSSRKSRANGKPARFPLGLCNYRSQRRQALAAQGAEKPKVRASTPEPRAGEGTEHSYLGLRSGSRSGGKAWVWPGPGGEPLTTFWLPGSLQAGEIRGRAARR